MLMTMDDVDNRFQMFNLSTALHAHVASGNSLHQQVEKKLRLGAKVNDRSGWLPAMKTMCDGFPTFHLHKMDQTFVYEHTGK